MALALVHCSIESDQGGIPHARARVSLVSWEGRSHALLFMVPLGLPSARPMAQALRLPFEYYYYYYYYFTLLTHYIYNRLDEATPLFVEPSILLPVHLPTQHSLASFVYTLFSLLLYSTHDGGLNQPFLYTALLQYCSDQVLKN